MKLFLYPYDYKNQFLLMGMNPSYEIKCVFVRENIKSDQKILKEKGIVVFQTLHIQEYLGQCDGVLFYWNKQMALRDFKSVILDNIKICLENKKEVYCTMFLDNVEIKGLAELAAKNQTRFHYMLKNDMVLKPLRYTPRLYKSEVPIIYIGELCEGIAGKELTAGIVAGMRNRGYRVCGILDDVCAGLIDMYTTPQFLRQSIQEEEKVIRFNQYIKKLETEQCPDLFVVQIPGSICQISERLFSNFGIYCYYYAHAFRPDIFFCTIPGNLCRDSLIERLSKNMEASYGFGLDGVLKSNIHLDLYEAFREGIIDTMFIEEKKGVREIKTANDISIIEGDIVDVGDMFCDIIVGTLSKEIIQVL